MSTTLRDASAAVLARGAPEQLLHGEPHPGNIIRSDSGVVFVDLETSCRGPVEFDIAHATIVEGAAPTEVARLYPGADVSLVGECWRLTLALEVAWRFEPGDDLPSRGARARDWLGNSEAPRAGAEIATEDAVRAIPIRRPGRRISPSHNPFGDRRKSSDYRRRGSASLWSAGLDEEPARGRLERTCGLDVVVKAA